MYKNNYKESPLAVGTAFDLTTPSGTILPLNKDRKGLIIFNTSAIDVQFGITNTGLITIKAGDHVAWVEACPMNAIGFKAASVVNIVVWEA